MRVMWALCFEDVSYYFPGRVFNHVWLQFLLQNGSPGRCFFSHKVFKNAIWFLMDFGRVLAWFRHDFPMNFSFIFDDCFDVWRECPIPRKHSTRWSKQGFSRLASHRKNKPNDENMNRNWDGFVIEVLMVSGSHFCVLSSIVAINNSSWNRSSSITVDLIYGPPTYIRKVITRWVRYACMREFAHRTLTYWRPNDFDHYERQSVGEIFLDCKAYWN